MLQCYEVWCNLCSWKVMLIDRSEPQTMQEHIRGKEHVTSLGLYQQNSKYLLFLRTHYFCAMRQFAAFLATILRISLWLHGATRVTQLWPFLTSSEYVIQLYKNAHTCSYKYRKNRNTGLHRTNALRMLFVHSCIVMKKNAHTCVWIVYVQTTPGLSLCSPEW